MRNNRSDWSVCVLFLLAMAVPAIAQQSFDFETDASLKAMTLTGSPTLDTAQAHGGKGKSLRLAAGDQLIIPLDKSDRSGSVSFWIYDDAAKAGNDKQRQAGALWGVMDSQGNRLMAGALYAPYLNGTSTYAATSYNAQKKSQPWLAVQYLGIKRKAQWQQWTFNWDADGLSILCDGKNVNASHQRFASAKVTLAGFNSIIITGDQTQDKNQVIWVDDVTVVLGATDVLASIGKPLPPAPKVVPDTDPALQGLSVKLIADVMATHPRLLFGKADLQTLRDTYNDPQNKVLRDNFLGFLPSCNVPNDTKFLTDATDGQRQGYWRLPTLTMHYLCTGDTHSRDKAIDFLKYFLKQPDWETGAEHNSGMSAANIMIGMALAYDCLYDELDPTLRKELKDNLWSHARAMYHGGHLMKNPGPHYWQGDPQNNHHWHRTAGALLCALAAYDGSPDQQWLIKELYNDVAWLAKWLPVDGTSHESPTYLIFGVSHLTFIMQAADHCFGTTYLQHPFFKHVGEFFVHAMLPGSSKLFDYGDSGGGMSNYSLAIYKAAAVHKQVGIQRLMDRIINENPKDFSLSWYGLLWRGPTLPGNSELQMEHAHLFDDIGVAFIRDGWKAGDVAGMFKCGPLGGYTLNAFRNENKFQYINVAHDDPDANSFTLYKDGEYLAQTDSYSKHKQSRNHNTILINGMGQRVPGRGEAGVWTQPAVGNVDMTMMANLTAWQLADKVVAIEGEASGAYLDVTDKKLGKSRPKLDRYRRTMLWVKGDYVLVLDDIRAPQPMEITWLMQGNQLLKATSSDWDFTLKHDKASCMFQVTPLTADGWSQQIVAATADRSGKALGYQQLQFCKQSKAEFLASVYFPWGGQGQAVITKQGDTLNVTVKTNMLTDQWSWTPANNNTTCSQITGTRDGKTLITLNASNSTPPIP